MKSYNAWSCCFHFNIFKVIAVVAWISIYSFFFFFVAEKYSTVWIRHLLSISSSADDHLGCFYFLAPVNHATVTLSSHAFVWTPVFGSFGCTPRREIAGSMAMILSNLHGGGSHKDHQIPQHWGTLNAFGIMEAACLNSDTVLSWWTLKPEPLIPGGQRWCGPCPKSMLRAHEVVPVFHQSVHCDFQEKSQDNHQQ